MRLSYISLGLVISFILPFLAYSQYSYKYDFSQHDLKLEEVGKGDCFIINGVLHSKDSYVRFGRHDMKNYSMSFKARVSKDAEQVQIWAGFRAYNRFDRYVVGIKGGLQDDVYLMRRGYMGTDEFLGVRSLGFHPIPGEWYKLRVDVCGNRIRVFVNDNNTPHIDLVDKNSSNAPSGEVTLGGGWIDTEFDDLYINSLEENSMEGIKPVEFKIGLSKEQKELKRSKERTLYQPREIEKISDVRSEISLDGLWLFIPEDEIKSKGNAISSLENDDNWHVMSVPNFWNPIRIWLHGETMPSPNGPQPKGVSDTYYQKETERCESYTFDYRKTRAAWYRQWVELPDDLKDRKIVLSFDAVAKAAEVYINGKLAGNHLGMFGNFEIDGTNLFKPGRNLIAIRVAKNLGNEVSGGNNAIDFFYSSVRESEKEDAKITVNNNIMKDMPHGFYGDEPSGIWQPVKLVITKKINVKDAFIKPSLDGASVDITIENLSDKKTKFNIFTDIYDKETGSKLYSELSLKNISLDSNDRKVYSYSFSGLKPRLWTPQHPNLYNFCFRLVKSSNTEIDCYKVTSGFRTFEIKDGLFLLNKKKYWLRGGNHIPFAIAPNDSILANTFMQLMKSGNIDVTRTHTTPWNELWMNAADNNGIGVSFEGTWPWLMILSTPMPDPILLKMWKEEFLCLLKKYRNHPSLLFWTVNNEMKFYDNDNDIERAKQKYTVISDVVKEMRNIDPTRPICFDSNYQKKGKDKKFGSDFMKNIDDGDIDDMHAYYNWYDFSIFRFFKGEFQNSFKLPTRPLISQEMSTGYPNNETGHPTRSYQLIHQNPQSLIGNQCYDYSNPKHFLSAQSFITGELAEALRRSNDQASGIMHFALLTWFRQVYDYKNIEPYPTYYALKRALQPVLVSAEIWGRNLYCGSKLNTRFYVVNDRENGSDLKPTVLHWRIQDVNGNSLKSGKIDIPVVKHYEHFFMEPQIDLPELSSSCKSSVKLVLKLTEDGLTVSENEYNLNLASRQWNYDKVNSKKIILLDNDNISQAFDFLGITYQKVESIDELLSKGKNADLCVISGMNESLDLKANLVRKYMNKGGKLLFLNSKETVKSVFPEYIKGWIIPTEGDIVNMEIEESPVFKDIDLLDLRYFNNNKREIPTACNATYKINRNDNLTELASQMKIHAYIDGGTSEDRLKKIDSMRGFTLFNIKDGKGISTVSSMCINKSTTDPIAGKLLVNMINTLINNNY